MSDGSWRRSPWEADPLSWFTTPNLPLAATALALAHGVVVLGPTGQAGSHPLVQVVALLLAVAALIWVHVWTRPHRGALTLPRVIVATALSSSAFVLSAFGYSGDDVILQLWWAPLTVSLLLLALAPYASAARLILVGAILIVVAVIVAVVLVLPGQTSWPVFTAVAIVVFPILIGVVGSVVMVRSITLGLARWSERPLDVLIELRDDELLIADVDATTRARVAAGVTLITAMIECGTVSEADATRAAALAELLRADLTSDADRTWLDRALTLPSVRLDDPGRLAEQLNLAQRTALRALLDALLVHPESPQASARIELRRTDSGAIAVALRILSTPPEGRRETFLAPYYVSLQSTVEKLRWQGGAFTAVEFEVAGDAERR